MHVIQHCFVCRPPDSTVSEYAGIEPNTVATLALTVKRSNHSARLGEKYLQCARSHPYSARSHPYSARSHPTRLYLLHDDLLDFLLVTCYLFYDATLALSVKNYNHSARSHSHMVKSHPYSAISHLYSAISHSDSTISHPHLGISHPHSIISHPRWTLLAFLLVICFMMRLWHCQSKALTTGLDFIYTQIDLIHNRLNLIQTQIHLISLRWNLLDFLLVTCYLFYDATVALSVKNYNHSARSHSHMVKSHPYSAISHLYTAISHSDSTISHPHSGISHPHSIISHPRWTLLAFLLVICFMMRLWHCQSKALTTRLDFIYTQIDLIHNRFNLIHTQIHLISLRWNWLAFLFAIYLLCEDAHLPSGSASEVQAANFRPRNWNGNWHSRPSWAELEPSKTTAKKRWHLSRYFCYVKNIEK